jgi:hypothetical protein
MRGISDHPNALWQQVRNLAYRGVDAVTWRAQARIDCVRDALRHADGIAARELQREFHQIEIGTVLSGLLDVLKDAALILLTSISIGTAAGAAVGALAGGVGAVPGAAAGAALGAKVGGWILAALGLKALAEFFIEGLPAILEHYRRGLTRAWAAPDQDDAGDDLRGGLRRQSEVRGAAVDISKGHVAMVLLLLSALVAYLTRGRGDIGQLAAQARRGKLGARFADWIVKHEAVLRNHPRLQGKRNKAAGETSSTSAAKTETQPAVTNKSGSDRVDANDALLANRQAVQKLGIPDKLSPRQHLHIPPVTDGRSVLTADPARLLTGLRNGEFAILRQPKPGQLVVDFGRPIGDFWSLRSGQPALVGPTNYGSVMYGKNGVHIVPANPVQW